jgi:hypothetical protein
LQFWYAIDVLKCRRVELKADVDNAKSRAAILRLGALEEGIFRKHMLYADGRNRDNVYFSVIDDDWPAVRAPRREARLCRCTYLRQNGRLTDNTSIDTD